MALNTAVDHDNICSYLLQHGPATLEELAARFKSIKTLKQVLPQIPQLQTYQAFTVSRNTSEPSSNLESSSQDFSSFSGDNKERADASVLYAVTREGGVIFPPPTAPPFAVPSQITDQAAPTHHSLLTSLVMQWNSDETGLSAASYEVKSVRLPPQKKARVRTVQLFEGHEVENTATRGGKMLEPVAIAVGGASLGDGAIIPAFGPAPTLLQTVSSSLLPQVKLPAVLLKPLVKTAPRKGF